MFKSSITTALSRLSKCHQYLLSNRFQILIKHFAICYFFISSPHFWQLISLLEANTSNLSKKGSNSLPTCHHGSSHLKFAWRPGALTRCQTSYLGKVQKSTVSNSKWRGCTKRSLSSNLAKVRWYTSPFCETKQEEVCQRHWLSPLYRKDIGRAGWQQLIWSLTGHLYQSQQINPDKSAGPQPEC